MREPLNYVFVSIGALGALLAAVQIGFFTLFDRDRLQDEEHIENKLLIQALQPMLGDSENVIEVEATGMDREGLTATVEIGGFDPLCARVASCSMAIP